MKRTRNRRGTLIVCFAAIIMVTGVMCSLVLLRSLDGYAASKRMESRLQALAAAEGAARLAADPGAASQDPIRIGNCTATARDIAGAQGERAISVTVHAPTGAEVFHASFLARYATGPDGARTLLEVVRP